MRTRTMTTPAMVQRAYELAARGWKHGRIARQIGNSPSCVSRILLGEALPEATVIMTADAYAELPSKYRKTPRQITASPTFRQCSTCRATYRTADQAASCCSKPEAKAQNLATVKKAELPPGRDELGELQEETHELYRHERDLVSRWASWGLDERDVRDLGRILVKLEVLEVSQLRLRLVGGES